MSIQAPLIFKGYEITRIVFEKPVGFSNKTLKVDVQHVNHVEAEDKNKFLAEFVLTVSDDKKLFNFQIQAIAHFEIKGDVIEEVYSNYLNISAPSIVYPYLRAFITNISVQAGMKPIIIPAINFAADKGELIPSPSKDSGVEKQ